MWGLITQEKKKITEREKKLGFWELTKFFLVTSKGKEDSSFKGKPEKRPL